MAPNRGLVSNYPGYRGMANRLRATDTLHRTCTDLPRVRLLTSPHQPQHQCFIIKCHPLLFQLYPLYLFLWLAYFVKVHFYSHTMWGKKIKAPQNFSVIRVHWTYRDVDIPRACLPLYVCMSTHAHLNTLANRLYMVSDLASPLSFLTTTTVH